MLLTRKRYLLFLLPVIIIGAGWLVAKVYLKDYLLGKLQTELQATFGGYYSLTFESIETTVDAGGLGVKIVNPELLTDTTHKQELNLYPPLYFHADELSVTGINVIKLLSGSTLSIANLGLNNPTLVILLRQLEQNPSAKNSKKGKKKPIDQILLKTFSIHHGHIALIQYNNLHDTFYYGNNITLELTHADIGVTGNEHFYRTSSFDNLRFIMRDVRFSPKNLYYTYLIGNLSINLKADVFEFNDLTLLPEKSLLTLSKDAGYQKTFASIRIGNVSLKGLDYKKLLKNQLIAKKAVISNGDIRLLRNKNKAQNAQNRKPAFQEMLNGLPLTLSIDSVLVRNIGLTAYIYFRDREEPAQIELDQLSGNILSLSNHRISEHHIRLALNAKLMNAGDITFRASFPPNSNGHSYQAFVGPMPVTAWSPVVRTASNLDLKSGNIRQIVLSGNATSYETSGNITFQYNDLKCSVLRDRKGELRKSPLLSFAGNMLIRSDNPSARENKPVSHAFYYKRESYQGVPMLWIGGLLDGITATIVGKAIKEEVDHKIEQKKREHLKPQR